MPDAMPRFRKILIGFLLAVFAIYYCETTCFVHSHVSELGIVTHSHPYLPGGAHSHTTLELQALSLLTVLTFTALALGLMPTLHRRLMAVIGQLDGGETFGGHALRERIRGPTDFICF